MASRTIGHVTRNTAKDSYSGQIATINLRLPVEIRPNRAKDGASQPDYIVYSGGQAIGGGWLAKEKDDMDYRSINCRVDDPSFDRELRFSTGRVPGQDDEDAFALIWNRTNGQQPPAD